MTLLKTFGRFPSGPRLQRIRLSPNYQNGSFQNLVPTAVMRKDVGMLKMIKDYRGRPVDATPPKPIPFVRTDLKRLPADRATLVWFGHSSYLLKLGPTHILVDPVFSGNASPFSFFAKAFPGADAYKAEDMPDTLEAVLLTHDHYDHLDYKTIGKLKDRTRHFYTSLGVGAHLESWGIPTEKITELDWWESVAIDPNGCPIPRSGDGPVTGAGPVSATRPAVIPTAGPTAHSITLTATPARHFSGRTFKRGRSAWSSFVLNAPAISIPAGNIPAAYIPATSAPGTNIPVPNLNLFLGGDSGYESHFKSIGDKYGPFDLAILECGQYNANWPYIHMQPEETVQAALDLRAKTLLPVHWAKFTLSLHPWNEPARRVKAAAIAHHLPLITPRIGEPVAINQDFPNDPWYEIL
jgi:L-ascorbate metabolism protein UlaG (beta-lactamase superfamily)